MPARAQASAVDDLPAPEGPMIRAAPVGPADRAGVGEQDVVAQRPPQLSSQRRRLLAASNARVGDPQEVAIDVPVPHAHHAGRRPIDLRHRHAPPSHHPLTNQRILVRQRLR